MQCNVIYEDQEIMVIHKPAGLATQSSGVGQKDVVSELKGYLAAQIRAHENKAAAGKKQENRKRDPYLGVVHRLDQPVEGLLVFAKTPAAADILTKQLGDGCVNKKYKAIVLGKPQEEKGSLTDYLRKEKNMAQVVTGQEKKYPDAKRAVLHYCVLGSFPCDDLATEKIADGKMASLLEVEIETGRFHQIRAQLSHAGFPLLGDQKYGSVDSLEISKKLGVRNVALCADQLEIILPKTKQEMDWHMEPKGTLFQKMFHLMAGECDDYHYRRAEEMTQEEIKR